MPDLSPQVKQHYIRRQYLVDRQFQLRFSLFFVGGIVLIGLLVGLLTYFPAKSLIQKQLYSPHIVINNSGELLAGLLWWLNLGFAFSLFLLALFLVVWHLRRTSASLNRLAGHLQSMAAGRIPAVIHFRRGDPLSGIAAEFNRMVNGLQDRQRRLNSHVQAAVHHLHGLELPAGGSSLFDREEVMQVLGRAARELEQARKVSLPAEK